MLSPSKKTGFVLQKIGRLPEKRFDKSLLSWYNISVEQP
jgi:hypothetical protein